MTERTLICPQLHIWRQLFTRLEEAHRQAADDGMPPPPPSYNLQAWELASNEHKRRRWEATCAWAREHGFSLFIDELSADDFYDGE